MNENSIVIHVMNVIYCAHRLQDIAILLEIQISRCYSLYKAHAKISCVTAVVMSHMESPLLHL